METTEAKGQIKRIYQNSTQGGKRYWVLSVQDEGGEMVRYSVWDWKMLEGVNEGDAIHFRYEMKNGYNNVSSVLKTERTGYAKAGAMDEYEAMRTDQISRMSALKSATQLMSTFDGPPETKLEKTIDAAKEFEKYIFGVLDADTNNNHREQDAKKKKKTKKEEAKAEPQAQEEPAF